MDGSRDLLISFPLLFAPPTRLVNWRKREREKERKTRKKERYEERTLSGNSIKGVREFSAKPERFWLGCGRILSRNRRPRQNPGSGFYIALRTCIISASFTYLDRPHHIPPLCLFLLIYIYMYDVYTSPRSRGCVRVSILYLAKYRMDVAFLTLSVLLISRRTQVRFNRFLLRRFLFVLDGLVVCLIDFHGLF